MTEALVKSVVIWMGLSGALTAIVVGVLDPGQKLFDALDELEESDGP